MVFRTLWWLIKWAIIITLCVLLIQYWLTTKEYLFTEEAVAAIAKKHIGTNVVDSYKRIHSELSAKYPGHILPEKDLQWIFTNAGGWMGSMCLVHASLTEYVLFFGTAMDTSGHSGRYWANISDTILTGTFKQWPEGALEVNVYKPGDTILHAWGETTGVHFAAGTWMLEYGRGFIPSTMTFALADTIFSTTDYMTLYYVLRIYMKALVQEAGLYVAQAKEWTLDYLS